jgi:endonuclease YncB( thermonuclease family)
MGNLARTRLKELIAQSGGKVEVIRNKPDNYARTVGEVTVKVNGRDVADILREEGLVLNYASGSPKKLYYNKFPGGAEQVWGEKLQEYRRNNPNSESITPLLNTLNRTENQTLRNDALVVNPNSQPTQ